MNFKKVFSAIVTGLITSTLFSNLSFASEIRSIRPLSEPKVVIIDKNTPKDKLKEYGLRKDMDFDGCKLYFLTDEYDYNNSYLEVSQFKNGTIRFRCLETPKEYRNKGYATLLLMAVLNSFKNKTIVLEDDCSICKHKENFCFYERFGFKIKYESQTNLSLRSMELKKGEEDINYKGNTENLIKLSITKL